MNRIAEKYKHLEELAKIANSFDEEGKKVEAEALDSLMTKIAKEIEEEKEEIKKEKGPRSLSGGAKRKFRSLVKACQSLVDADVDCRGPHKKECKKIEDLCEEILTLAEKCDFGMTESKEEE